MDTSFEVVLLLILYLLSFTACIGLMIDIIPRYLLKVNYSVSGRMGRGLKKMVYPNGRAVVYEPHPSVRKYVNKYLLFTLDGYKYIQSKIGAGVNRYTASVVCFDSRNAVIDVLDITESVASALSIPVRLHHKTSHVAYVLTSVNGKTLSDSNFMTVKLTDAPRYIIAASATIFLHFMHALATVKRIVILIDGYIVPSVGNAFFIIPSIIVAAICFGVTIAKRAKKGIKVVRK